MPFLVDYYILFIDELLLSLRCGILKYAGTSIPSHAIKHNMLFSKTLKTYNITKLIINTAAQLYLLTGLY